MSKDKRVLLIRRRDGRKRYVNEADVKNLETVGWAKATKAEADAGGYALSVGDEDVKTTNEKGA